MKIFRKTVSAVLLAAALLWYASPSVQTLLVGAGAATGSAPGLSVREDGVREVQSTTDERLSTGRRYTVRLFGAIPLRTVETIGNWRQLVASGAAIGIRMQTQGVQIVGFGGIRTKSGTVHPAQDAGLMPGDAVLSINGVPVETGADFSRLCDSETPVELRFLRDGAPQTVSVAPALDEDGVYRIGAWVRDSTSGVGTLSFYDPASLRYAALGHGISDVDTGVLFGNGGGQIYAATIVGAVRASGGEAGELIGVFSGEETDAIGAIGRNTVFGVSGTLYAPIDGTAYPLASPDEIRFGDAETVCTVDGAVPQRYRVRVIRKDVHASPQTNGIMIEVVDRALLDRTGGIVQGMSGSPVLQNGMLIGVVTHVFLNDSARGYCIYAAQMAEKLLESD
ncbi:MAG: PDZ domain-containing protein [Clostridia bacterium]|nr:PDZ domain-containing protein [Clostridia bacterium]